MVNGEVIVKSDEEVSDQQLANRLSKHNPRNEQSQTLKIGDLVMIRSAKTKLKPSDTYIIQSFVELNGTQWAELYKIESKLNSKPQLVKIEEIIKVPKGEQRPRAAKRHANKRMKDLLPYIRALVQAAVPTHAWSYSDVMQEFLLCDSSDDEAEEDEDYTSDLLGERRETEVAPGLPVVVATQDNLAQNLGPVPVEDAQVKDTETPSTSVFPPRMPRAHSRESVSSNLFPRYASQVDLGSVQNLDNLVYDFPLEESYRGNLRRSKRSSSRSFKDGSQNSTEQSKGQKK